MVAVSILIARYPGYLGMSRERVRSTLLMYNAAFVVFVALDLVSDRALTSMTDLPKAASVLLFAIAAALIANLIYLLVRHRVSR